MKTGSNRIPHFVRFLVSVYLVSLLLLACLRIFLILYVTDANIPFFNRITLRSLPIGMQFDNVVLAYILALPILLLYIHSILQIRTKILPVIVTVFLSLMLPLLLFIVIADIPYFQFFKNRLTESSLQWMGSIGIVLKMIAGNPAHLGFLAGGLLLVGSSGYLLYTFCRKKLIDYHWKKEGSGVYYSAFFLLLAVLCFGGMRGSFSHPIRQGDAFYCEDPILNQIGLNPAFTLLKSFTDKVQLMDEKLAIQNTQRILSITAPITSISPIARKVEATGPMKKHNVILVLMEGMSAHYMSTFGNKDGLTPTLDSLAANAWLFTNAYSAGIHTNNGIFSSLFSFPALKRVRPMSTVPARTYSGFPYTLKHYGYTNLFFSPHSGMFDNMNIFLPANYFDRLYTSDEYPQEKHLGPFGVPDDYLFTHAMTELDKRDTTKPFFATILTVSNHSPYTLPPYFKSPFEDKSKSGVFYADWSIGQFLNKVKQKPWFSNTLFIFVADHGLMVGENAYDLALSYNHIPIILYNPHILGAPKKMDQFTGQIDIFPTVMGILQASYINNTLGVDALKQPRTTMFFNADNKMGCIDPEWLYVYRYNGGESLYRYQNGNKEDLAQKYPEILARMKEQALSQSQVAEWMFVNDKTKVEVK